MARLSPLDEILSTPDDPLDEILNAQLPAPGGGGGPVGLPSTGEPSQPLEPGVPPQFGGRIVDAILWAAQNPQMALDLAGQGVFGSLGIAGGTVVGGPVGGMAGGAAGNVLGKQVAREVGGMLGFPGSEKPDYLSTETAIDAGAGAAGPVVNKALQLGGRTLTGLSRQGVTAAEKQGAKEMAHIRGLQQRFNTETDDLYKQHQALWREQGATKQQMRDLKDATYGPDSVGGAKIAQFERAIKELPKVTKELTDVGVEKAVLAALMKAQQGAQAKDLALPAGIGALVSGLEPITGLLLGAGVGKVVIEKAVPKLLNNKHSHAFARWALDVKDGKIPSGQIATSFSAMLAERGIGAGKDVTKRSGADGGSDVADGGGGPQGRSAREASRRVRDPRTGQFTSPSKLGYTPDLTAIMTRGR